MIHLREVSSSYLCAWIGIHLSTNDWRKFTQQDFDRIDAFIKGDGCSGVPDFYRNGCVIHDWGYRTHRDFKGNYVSQNQVDNWIKKYIQSKSLFGKFSPMAAWRYLALKNIFGNKAWNNEPEPI